MLNITDKNTVLSILTDSLGSCTNLSKGELQFSCPFCNHHNPRLQVNINTQKWHCWVCNSGGNKMTSMLRKLDVPYSVIGKIRDIYGDVKLRNPSDAEDTTVIYISLPEGFISLSTEPSGFNPEYKQAMAYLSNRGIGLKEIVKYNIGYCTEGTYARRVIIPSYDEDGKLNYFVSRSYYANEKLKYKNPPITKNIVCFESQIDWKQPIILCEGVFDAIAIRRNAIPLLGKFPSKQLMERIFLRGVKQLTIALDNDALKDALKIADYLNRQGITVRMLKTSDKDASEMGYEEFYKQLNTTRQFSSEELLLMKIQGL